MDTEDEIVVSETGAEDTGTVDETTETPAEGEEGETTPEGEADAALEAEEGAEGESEGEEEEETEEGAEGEAEAEATGPVTKFKAGVWNKESKTLEQKEFEIDKRFHTLMKDPEGEKLIRELHEKAYGLDSIKERFNETRATVQSVTEENRAIKQSIDGVRQIYQSAVKTGNLHKLDTFFEKLQIPIATVLQYAMAKVELNEMPPEQRQVLEAKLLSEKQADDLRLHNESQQSQMMQQTIEMKNVLVDSVLERPAISALASEFDARKGKPGAFKEAVFKEGQLAWATEGVDLPPQEAVKRVIENYGLATGNHNLPPGQQATGKQNGTVQASGTSNASGKKVVQRTDKTIPNISGRSTSPLPSKMKSVDDIVKYRKQHHGA